MLDYIYEMRHDKLQRKPFIQAASQRLGKDIGVPFIPCFLFSSSKFGGPLQLHLPGLGTGKHCDESGKKNTWWRG